MTRGVLEAELAVEEDVEASDADVAGEVDPPVLSAEEGDPGRDQEVVLEDEDEADVEQERAEVDADLEPVVGLVVGHVGLEQRAQREEAEEHRHEVHEHPGVQLCALVLVGPARLEEVDEVADRQEPQYDLAHRYALLSRAYLHDVSDPPVHRVVVLLVCVDPDRDLPLVRVVAARLLQQALPHLPSAPPTDLEEAVAGVVCPRSGPSWSAWSMLR